MEISTVLLVFEEPEDLEYYGSLVCSLGYSIRMCNSVEEGIEAIKAENFSLVILSQGTSAFEGRKVLECSLQLKPDLPVLVIARTLNVRCYLEAMDLGASDYLERPEPRDLVWVVNTQMNRAGMVAASNELWLKENGVQTIRTRPHAV